MKNLLPEAAPGFDQPVAVLKHCHGRIRKQLATLDKLLVHLPEHGADEQARQAASAVMNYFDKAAHLHHADEELDLIPMLRAVAQGEDAATLQALAPVILQDHQEMDALWNALRPELELIAAGSSPVLAAGTVQRFIQRYTAHMEREESTMAPMALRLFSPEQMGRMGQSMQARRGLSTASAEAKAIGDRVHGLRKDYGQASLSEEDVNENPMAQFTRWFEEALKAEVSEPNAMSVATVGPGGRPSSRIVLVKQFDERGFTWYTNYDSQKGQQLRANPFAALLFFWNELERQVRIEGRVEQVSDDESDTYFHSRPLKSRLGAIASQQSAPIDSRAALEQRYEAVARQYGEEPPRPSNWGGFRLVPERIEFWQGRNSRFHDRIVYTRHEDGHWTRQRLQP
jgi:pyridoxamine 5'-phosphate oxidase